MEIKVNYRLPQICQFKIKLQSLQNHFLQGIISLSTYYNCMFTLISKKVYQRKVYLALDRFYKFQLEFDGSLSRCIQNLSGEKLKIANIHHRTAKLETLKKEALHQELEIKGDEVEVRYSELTTPKLQTLLFARSYWAKNAYDQIMAKNPTTPIGFNLIDQKIQTFRQINWIGQATIKLDNDFELMGLSRSYSIKSNNEIICEVEQYFTPKFNRLFY